MGFHTIKSIKSLDNMILEAKFSTGEIRKYDMKVLINKYKKFKVLENNDLFYKVKLDIGGYGIVWNDDLDLSSEEIWKNGY